METFYLYSQNAGKGFFIPLIVNFVSSDSMDPLTKNLGSDYVNML